jgi:shikimate 5-dehydrogenase
MKEKIPYPITKKEVPTFYFIGVTTSKSAIRNVFPKWMSVLGREDVVLEGIDHKLHDDPEAYRASVAQIKYDLLSLGGLVTSHKINLLNASQDMFDSLHESAILTGEVSSISKRGTELWGHAKDPLTGGLSLDAVTGKGYFGKTGGQVLCFGAGGSGKAISLHLVRKEDPADRPDKMIVVNRSKGNLNSLQKMVSSLNTDIEFEYIQGKDPSMGDEIMERLPEGSVVINATGAGKDFPGSPVSDSGIFPSNGIAWEINYRGELDFWHQAMAQQETRNLQVEDGWLYFLHGWTQVIAEVLHIDLDEVTFNKLSEAAQDMRPSLNYVPREPARFDK